jgi:heme exporter protein C
VSWQWFHRLGSPRWFYEKTSAWLPWLALVAALLVLVGIVWGLGFAPTEHKQGNSYRIIYIHVPVAFMAQAGYIIMALCGAIGLIWKMKLSFMVMKSAAPIGAAMTFIALITGYIWGVPTWGDWRILDARIVFMMILLFLYFGVIVLQAAFVNRDSADKACAVLALAGSVNIPIIQKSVDWWYSLHQPASIKFSGKSAIDPSMLYPLLISVIGFYCLYLVILLIYTRMEILRREQRTQWVKDLVAQHYKK